ncbi:MAG: glutaredoxin domain-containing protein [Dehalococcoidia bacterium]
MPDPVQHTVVVFTQAACEFSEMVRLHLESRRQPYDERDIDLDPRARDELLRLGATGTPVTVIDGEVIVGYDEVSIDELLGFEPYGPREDLSAPLADVD